MFQMIGSVVTAKPTLVEVSRIIAGVGAYNKP
jgi:hypothetical protein